MSPEEIRMGIAIRKLRYLVTLPKKRIVNGSMIVYNR